MTIPAAASPSLALSGLDRREAFGWGAAAAAVLAAHLAIAYTAQHLRPSEPAGSDSPPALTIELASIASMPAVAELAEPADEVPPDMAEPVDEQETITAAEPDRAVKPSPERAEETPVVDREEPATEEAALPVEPDQRIEAEPVETPQEPLDEVVPDVVEAVDPEVVIPLPEPVPIKTETAEKKKDEKPAPKAAKKKVETAAPKKEKTKKSSKPAASATADAKPAPRGAEGVSKPRVSPAKWQSKVVSWLRRHQRYPSGAKSRREEGNAQVAFTIDASGRVKSARIARSSGNADLDHAALDMVRRSSPVPAPPPEIARPSMSIVVPVAFSLR